MSKGWKEVVSEETVFQVVEELMQIWGWCDLGTARLVEPRETGEGQSKESSGKGALAGGSEVIFPMRYHRCLLFTHKSQ